MNKIAVTIWQKGEWIVWGVIDAFYAQEDDDYIITIPAQEILNNNDEFLIVEGLEDYPITISLIKEDIIKELK